MSATKQRSKTTTRSQRISTAVHVDTEDGLLGDSESPLSPAFMSRKEEKNRLSCLNDRLAQYIDRVRQLEAQNSHLIVQIRDVEVVERREKSNIRTAYEAELADARKLLDDTSKEKAKIQIDADKARGEFDDLKAKNAKFDKDLKISETGRLNSESLVQDLQARVNIAENIRKHAEKAAKTLDAEKDAINRQLDTARRQLEEETLLRVDLENRLQSLKEELEFKMQLYAKVEKMELEETRRKRKMEVTTVSKELETEYNTKLQEQLNQMRSNLDEHIAYNRREVEEMYKIKLDEANSYAHRSQGTVAEVREELSGIRIKVRELERADQDHQMIVDGLNRKINELESHLKYAREDGANNLHNKDQEIASLREDIQRMLTDYQDLMDTKIQLDVELQAYHKLLESEESRLHLTPPSSPVSESRVETASSSRRGTKRKRTLRESDALYDYNDANLFKTTAGAEGEVEIAELDTNGVFIRLDNHGEEDVPIGGWFLKTVASGREVSYKFHQRQNLKPHKQITIWSSTSKQTHEPPSNLVMKNQQWPTGDDIRSILVDSEGQQKAWKESTRTHGYPPVYNGSLNEGDKRCVIM